MIVDTDIDVSDISDRTSTEQLLGIEPGIKDPSAPSFSFAGLRHHGSRMPLHVSMSQGFVVFMAFCYFVCLFLAFFILYLIFESWQSDGPDDETQIGKQLSTLFPGVLSEHLVFLQRKSSSQGHSRRSTGCQRSWRTRATLCHPAKRKPCSRTTSTTTASSSTCSTNNNNSNSKATTTSAAAATTATARSPPVVPSQSIIIITNLRRKAAPSTNTARHQAGQRLPRRSTAIGLFLA